MKVGNLVKRRDPPWGSERNFGLVTELEIQRWNNVHICKVKWAGSEEPPLMYRIKDLILVCEAK